MEPLGQPLDRPEGDVPFAPFEAPDVGAVYPQEICERLLTLVPCLALVPEIDAEPALEVTFHYR